VRKFWCKCDILNALVQKYMHKYYAKKHNMPKKNSTINISTSSPSLVLAQKNLLVCPKKNNANLADMFSKRAFTER